MVTIVTRRAFLAGSAGSIAFLAAGPSGAAGADSSPVPTGPVYGRVGRRGIPPGTASAPSRGDVIQLDGRVLVACHVTGRGIRPGASVLLVPDAGCGWSILYAELSA
jgi:hypothetical protein